MIVVAIILALAAIAIPPLNRSRAAANEASAVASMPHDFYGAGRLHAGLS